MSLSIAFSPCPNDTFVFHAWVHGLLPGTPRLTSVRYADIDVTNGLATRGELDILKISYAALPWVLQQYVLLPCGGALGRGCGPLVLTRPDGPARPADLAGHVVAVPAERSTAYLLLRLWASACVPGGLGPVRVLPFAAIMPAVRDGTVAAGLVIHEARFTYPGYGLHCLVDLGQWWEDDTGLPIPLGAIVARRSLEPAVLASAVRASVEYAWAHPEVSRDYVMEHAQEMDAAVAEAHIGLYVNAFTKELGVEGYGAVRTLLDRAATEGLVPPVEPAAMGPVFG
jgi:1,4-dihydroxy-6-naphthoate synthase